MKNVTTFIFFRVLFIFVCTTATPAWSFSIVKPVSSSNSFKYLQVAEFVKLSATEFASITGKKMNLWERISFKIMKMQMKHELRKKPDLTLNEFYQKNKHPVFNKMPLWLKIVLGVVICFLLFLVIRQIIFALYTM